MRRKYRFAETPIGYSIEDDLRKSLLDYIGSMYNNDQIKTESPFKLVYAL